MRLGERLWRILGRGNREVRHMNTLRKVCVGLGVAVLGFGFAGQSARAQQSGVIIGRTPGSAIGKGLPTAVAVPPPKPACDAPAATDTDANTAPALPDMVFSREDLICVRHGDGRSEELRGGFPWGFQAATDTRIAYWIPEKHELHVFSVADRRDTVVDTLPSARMEDIIWSSKGHTLAYLPSGADPPGIRLIDMDSGRRTMLTGSFLAIVPSPDADFVVGVAPEGVERIRLSDGHKEIIAAVVSAVEAAYSPSGALLGVMASPPPDPNAAASASSAEDDTPDCTGASFDLLLQRSASKHLVKVPFPDGFDNVLDFEFSPDDRAIAVTFGVTGCDYPGDAARVYMVSLPDLQLTPISPADRLGVQAHWSPDGTSIVYSDYTGSDSPLVAVDLRTRKLTRLTSPGENGPDRWLRWRNQPSRP